MFYITANISWGNFHDFVVQLSFALRLILHMLLTYIVSNYIFLKKENLFLLRSYQVSSSTKS